MNDRARSFLLFASWGACLALGLTSAAIFVAGVARDTHFGQVDLAVDLGEVGPWRGADFRVWDSGNYVLWLTTLRPQPPFDPTGPAPAEESALWFDGILEARVLTPDNDVYAEWSYDGRELEHAAAGGMTWTRLADVTLLDLPLRPWRIEARTTTAAPAFSADPDLSTRLLLRPDRPDVGMGGLISYAMIVPAVLFLCLAVVFGLVLGRLTGRWWPTWVSGICLALFATAITLR